MSPICRKDIEESNALIVLHHLPGRDGARNYAAELAEGAPLALQAQKELLAAMESLPLHNEDGAGGNHAYVPWWLYQEQLAGKLGFARGYHIEFTTGRQAPNLNVANPAAPGYGRAFKEDLRRTYGSFVGFSGRISPNATAGELL